MNIYLCVFPDIVKDCPKMRNFPKIYLRSFENVALWSNVLGIGCGLVSCYWGYGVWPLAVFRLIYF